MPSDDFKERAHRIGWMLDDIIRLSERGGVQINADSRPSVLFERLRELQSNADGLSSQDLHSQLDNLEQKVKPMYDSLVATRKRAIRKASP